MTERTNNPTWEDSLERRVEALEATEAEFESVRILRLQPGDTLVVRVDQHLTPPQVEGIKGHMHGLFPDHQVLVLGPNTDVEILREGDDA